MNDTTTPRQLTPVEAIQILDAATTPANISRLNRGDYINIQHALEVLAKAVSPPQGEQSALGAGLLERSAKA